VTLRRAGLGWIGRVTYVVRVGAALVGLAAAGLLAACGGHATAGTSGAAPAASGFQAYADCLRQHGVTVTVPSGRPTDRPTARPTARPSGVRPSGNRGGGFPGFGGAAPSGVDPSTWAAAQEACSGVRPSFGGGGRGANNGAIAAYRNCLRDHGVMASNGPEALNTADPKVAAAVQACAPLRPTTRPS
jgi:hypothetical protein